MTDIIERLRYYRMECGDFPALDVLMGEAADEIERLRGVVESWKHSYKLLDERREQVEAERDAAMKMLGYVRLPAQRALGTVNWIRPADEPPPNVMVNWYTNADTLTELLKMTEGTP